MLHISLTNRKQPVCEEDCLIQKTAPNSASPCVAKKPNVHLDPWAARAGKRSPTILSYLTSGRGSKALFSYVSIWFHIKKEKEAARLTRQASKHSSIRYERG